MAIDAETSCFIQCKQINRQSQLSSRSSSLAAKAVASDSVIGRNGNRP